MGENNYLLYMPRAINVGGGVKRCPVLDIKRKGRPKKLWIVGGTSNEHERVDVISDIQNGRRALSKCEKIDWTFANKKLDFHPPELKGDVWLMLEY